MRFIRQVVDRDDTPSMIVLIASDAEYLRVCRQIVGHGAGFSPNFAQMLSTVCRAQGLNPDRLKEMLTPAASALGIVQAIHAPADYYRLLRIRPHADAQEIKMAFRRQARKLHPDANTDAPGSSQRFIQLNDAYQTLRNPVLRHRYDTSRQHLLRWCERPGLPGSINKRPSILLLYVCGLLLIFIILVVVLDKMDSFNGI